MKPHLLILLSAHLLICSFACSQTITRQLFGAGGSNAVPINGTYYVNWSMGEAVINTLNNGLPQLTQGFQQPEIIIPLAAGNIDLAVRKAGKDAFLNWVDGWEGACQYQLSFMQKGFSWQVLGQTPTDIFRHYDIPVTGGPLYYRLTALGLDGSVRHSHVVELLLDEVPGPHIFPNPTTDILNISGLSPESHLQLYDMSGKLLADRYASGTVFQLDLSGFPAALYMLRIQQAEKSFSFKVEVR